MPVDQFGNPYGGYGDQQAQYTMSRAAYGDVAAGMMMGAGTAFGGAASGMGQMFGDMGRMVMPTHYTPPARVYTGYYGQYIQPTSFFGSLGASLGLGSVPRGTTAMEYYETASGDFGTRLGSGLAAAGLSLAGTAVSAGLYGAGAAAGRFVGASALRAAGLEIGGTMAGGIIGAAGIAGGLGIAMAGYAATESVMRGVEQRQEIQSSLQNMSFRFVGPGGAMSDPRTGAGMSRAARMEVTDFIRQMDIADPMLNTQDLTTILNKGSQMGMFTGTSSMSDFKKKFKDMTESVKSVVNILHTTLEEGMQTLKDLRSVGIEPANVRATVQGADMMGRIAGRTGMEMMGLGLQGAELFRGTGVSMQIGMQANMMNISAIRAARDAGTLSLEAIAQAGGEEAMAQRMTAGGLAFSQSAMGRGMGGAFFRMGGPGGGFSAADFTNFIGSGGGDFVGTFQTAAGRLGNVASLRTFQANQEKFMSELGSAFGGRGLQFYQSAAAASQAAFMSNATGASREVEFINAMKEMGVAQPDIEARLAEIKGRKNIYQTTQASINATALKMTVEEATQNFFLNRFKARAGDMVTNVQDMVAQPLDHMKNSVANRWQEFNDKYVTGISRVDASQVDLSVFGTARDRRGRATISLAGVNLATSGFSSRDMADVLRSAEKTGLLGRLGGKIGRAEDIPGAIGLGRGQGIAAADLERIAERASIIGMTGEEASHLAKKEDINATVNRLSERMIKGDITSKSSVDDVIKAMSGGKLNEQNIKSEDFAKIRAAVQGTSLEKVFETERRGALNIFGAYEGATVEAVKNATQKYDQIRSTIESTKVGGEALGQLGHGTLERLAEIRLEKDPRRRAQLEAGISERLLKTGMSPEKFRAVMEEFHKGGVVTAAQAGEIRETAKTIAGGIAVRGQELLSDSLTALTKEKVFDDNAQRREQALTVAQKVRTEGLAGLKKEDIDAFKGTSMESFLRDAYTDVQHVRRGKLSQKEAREIVSKGMYGLVTSEQQSEFMGKLTGDEATRTQAMRELSNRITQGVSGTQFGFAAGGSLVGGMNQPNASQQAAIQTSLNSATLAAMEGLARKLKIQ